MDNLISLVSPETKFEFVSGEFDVVKATETGGKKMLHGVASSTTKDLHGDTILQSALEDMERTAVGMTIFLNHSYRVPQDVAGTVTRSIIRQRGVDQAGDPNYQLEFDIEIEEDNEDAVKTWRYIKKGRKLGLSIGAMIPEGGAKRQKDGSYLIEHVVLLETSLVGIPANPKSWIDYAASALRGMIEKGTTTNLGNPTLTLEGGRYKIEGSIDGIDLGLAAPNSTTIGEAGQETFAVLLGSDGQPLTGPEVGWQFAWDRDNKVAITKTVTTPLETGMAEFETVLLGAWDLTDPDERLLAVASAGEEAVQKATVWVETRDGDKITIGDPAVEDSTDPEITSDTEPQITAASSCPTCGKGRGASGCSDDFHKSADPDVTDAKVRIIEVDTDDKSDDSSQGASSSEPEDAGVTDAAPQADVTAAGETQILEGLPEEELLKLSFGQLRAIALRTTTELVAVKQALAEEKAARILAEQQRDDVADAAAELVRRTSQIIDKVASAPLPRKAVLKHVEQEFSASVESYYGTEFARALAGKK